MPLVIQKWLECDSDACAVFLDVSKEAQPVIAGRKAGWCIVSNSEANGLDDPSELTFCPECGVDEG